MGWRANRTERGGRSAGFVVLTLPEGGPEPQDSRRIIRLTGVSRVVVSYWDGRWDDPEAPVLPFGEQDLDAVIQEFGQLPVYGWEFIDLGDEQFNRWRNRLSFDGSYEGKGMHTIDLFQENGMRILDFRAWFDDIEVFDVDRRRIPLTDFIEGGVRWWNGLYSGDNRTDGHGIVPVKSDG